MPRVENIQAYRQHEKYIPIFQVTDYTAFTDQPNDDALSIVSGSASDVQKMTIWFTDHSTGLVEYEVITLTGTTPVVSTSSAVDNFLGAFLGDEFGTISSPAVGSITIKTQGGSTAIATILATKWSIGLVLFYLAGRNIEVENIAGNTFINCANPVSTVLTNAEKLVSPSVPSLASKTSMQLAGRMSKFVNVPNYISLASDSSGSTVQITVLA